MRPLRARDLEATVDEDIRESGSPTRWLGWAVTGLLIAGVVSIGPVSSAGRGQERVVAAAGSGLEGVEPPPPPTLATFVPPPPELPPVPTTTAPASAPAPTSTSTTRAAAPTTTQAPRPTTTAPATTARPAVEAPATTTTAKPSTPGTATVTLANDTTYAWKITLNDRVFNLAPGQQTAPTEIALFAHGNDTVTVEAAADATCGVGDADNYFDAGGRYRFAIVTSAGMCRDMPGPQIKVTKL